MSYVVTLHLKCIVIICDSCTEARFWEVCQVSTRVVSGFGEAANISTGFKTDYYMVLHHGQN